HGAGKSVNGIQRHPHGFGNIADSSFLMELSDRSHNTGPIPTVFLINILNDFFSALVFKIHINIGRFVTRGRNEPFEKQIEFGGIDGGDAYTKTNGRIRRGTTALAKNSSSSCLLYNIIYREKVGRIIHFTNKLHLMLYSIGYFFWKRVSEICPSTFPSQMFEFLGGSSLALIDQFSGIHVC